MKEKIKKFLDNGRGALVALFVLELLLMIFVTPNKYDDAVFLENIHGKSIISYVGPRYFTWTSRFLIEYVLCLVLRISKYLWILIEALMVTLVGYSLSKLFIKDNRKENTLMLVFMILTYPITLMNGAGWAATTVNYMWPLATCLFALIPIRKIWDGEKIKFWQYPLYVIALIFSANAEQTCAILLGTYLLFAILMIIKNKKIHPFMVIQTLLIIASLIFILTCPGNAVRTMQEAEAVFKDYEMFTILDKIGLGFTSTMGIIVKNGNIAFTIMSILMVVYVFSNYKETLYRTVALVPIFSIFTITNYGKYLVDGIFPYFASLRHFLTNEQVMLTAISSNNLLYTIPFIFAAVNIICVIMTLLLIFKNLKDNTALLVFLIGLAARFIVVFSPTVFLSGERTMLFLDFAMIIVSYLVWQELIKKNDKNDKKIQKRVEFIIKASAVLQYANCLIAILMTQK